MIRDLDDAQFADALRLRPLHRHRAGQPLRLRRRAHVQPPADGGVLADPARLLRLRRHDRRRRRASDYATPAMSNSIVLFTGTMTDSVRNTIEEYGPERLQPGDVIVANDPYRTGTHVNDMLFVRPVFHDGAILAFVNLKAHQLDMGGAVPGGFSGTKRTVYENGLVVSPRAAVQRRRARARDLEPDLRQRALRRDPLPRHADDLSPACDLGERLLVESARALRRRGAARHDATTSATPTPSASPRPSPSCPTAAGTAEDMSRLRRRRRRRGVPGAGRDHQARRSPRGRLQRHLAPGPHLHQRHRAGRQDDGRRRGEVPARPARRVHLGPLSQHRHRAARGHGHQRAAARRRGVRLLRAEPGDALRAAARVRRRAGARAIAGDRGGTDIHNAFGLRPDGTPWVSAAQCGGEVGPFGATRHGDGETPDVLLPGQRRRDRGGGDRGRRPGRDAAPRAAARQRAARAPPRRRGDGARHAVDARPPSTT